MTALRSFFLIGIYTTMSIIVPFGGERYLLDSMIKSSDEDFLLRLYKNDYTPTLNSSLTDFVEANFSGYNQMVLSKNLWDNAVIVDPVSPCVYSEAISVYSVSQNWTCGEVGGNVYGIYIVGENSSSLIWADRFAESPQVLSELDVLTITPQIRLRTQIPCS
jgi:hypothetical protein